MCMEIDIHKKDIDENDLYRLRDCLNTLCIDGREELIDDLEKYIKEPTYDRYVVFMESLFKMIRESDHPIFSYSTWDKIKDNADEAIFHAKFENELNKVLEEKEAHH